MGTDVTSKFQLTQLGHAVCIAGWWLSGVGVGVVGCCVGLGFSMLFVGMLPETLFVNESTPVSNKEMDCEKQLAVWMS